MSSTSSVAWGCSTSPENNRVKKGRAAVFAAQLYKHCSTLNVLPGGATIGFAIILTIVSQPINALLGRVTSACRKLIQKPNGVIHTIVENQLALEDQEVVRFTLLRLIQDGLTRHEAIHAIGSVLAEHVFDLLQKVTGITTKKSLASSSLSH